MGKLVIIAGITLAIALAAFASPAYAFVAAEWPFISFNSAGPAGVEPVVYSGPQQYWYLITEELNKVNMVDTDTEALFIGFPAMSGRESSGSGISSFMDLGQTTSGMSVYDRQHFFCDDY